jgi:hypothetical protein
MPYGVVRAMLLQYSRGKTTTTCNYSLSLSLSLSKQRPQPAVLRPGQVLADGVLIQQSSSIPGMTDAASE